MTPRRQFAVDGDPHVFGFILDQCLRREHMLDFAGADAVGERTKGAVCRRCDESPQTIVVPGSVKPCSGPMTCTMP